MSLCFSATHSRRRRQLIDKSSAHRRRDALLPLLVVPIARSSSSSPPPSLSPKAAQRLSAADAGIGSCGCLIERDQTQRAVLDLLLNAAPNDLAAPSAQWQQRNVLHYWCERWPTLADVDDRCSVAIDDVATFGRLLVRATPTSAATAATARDAQGLVPADLARHATTTTRLRCVWRFSCLFVMCRDWRDAGSWRARTASCCAGPRRTSNR